MYKQLETKNGILIPMDCQMLTGYVLVSYIRLMSLVVSLPRGKKHATTIKNEFSLATCLVCTTVVVYQSKGYLV